MPGDVHTYRRVASVTETDWFEGVKSVGELQGDDLLDYLRSVDDPSVESLDVDNATERRFLGLGEKKAFQHTGNEVGYIAERDGEYLSIVDPRDVAPQRDLSGRTVTIQLTQALVVRYPGRGAHQILLHFDAGGRDPAAERFRFSTTMRSADGNRPAIAGQILFSGLKVGADGLSIRMKTINVCSEDDQKLLSVTESDVFRTGLDLAKSTGPVIGMLSVTLDSIAQFIAGRAKNRPVQDGLVAGGFDTALADAPKLRPGTYVMTQAPSAVEGVPWSWGDYVFDRQRGAIVRTTDHSQPIGYNYVAIGVAPAPA